MNRIESDAALICAHLLRQGYVRKDSFPQLALDDNLMINVQERLAQVGMKLVVNSFSPYYAVRMVKDVQDLVEESNNIGLRSNEVAMLVILWSKLIFPKRVVSDPEAKVIAKPASLESTENNISAENTDNNLPAEKDQIFVKVSELYAEFGKHFGNKTVFKSVLSRLSNLKFINMHNEIVSEGLFLDLLIDGHEMANEIKRSALAYKLAGLIEDEEVEEWTEEDGEDDFPDLSDQLVVSEIDTSKKEGDKNPTDN